MTLLVSADELHGRRAVARGSLAPLADGLRRELAPLVAEPPTIPDDKAMLSRAGGRCDRDGSLLVYDPADPRHRCGVCGRELRGPEHDRFRLYWHHLWLAERAVHAALLARLMDDDGCAGVAMHILDGYAERYLHYPNRDNVLGPSRPFFSTYLESIWLLQLSIALDLLETGLPAPRLGPLGARVRERLIAPSVALIAGFDEGASNRQVWNNAALIAGGRLLGDDAVVERAIAGPSGLHSHLGEALLDDGSWYEGENYHLFAHRGLWYGVQLAEQAGRPLAPALARRFADGFAAPFRTVLPDLTYPSRRDSQYAVSVRQPRFAESCELGLARGDDERLVGMLARLYDPAVPRAATGRAASSADVERNLPASGLTRADLSWRALLLARETLPPLVATPWRSDLLPAQGFGVLRRDGGTLYAALDFGHPGGGHGHPDRLNLLLVEGATRWFDDPGTGSYVDPSLHWYRSTLAHTAPLVDGRSQPRVHGSLVAFDDQPTAAWVSAEAALAPGLEVRRSVVVLDDYLVDLVQWEGAAPHELALPLHGVDVVDASGRPAPRHAEPIVGGEGLEDGFSFLRQTARVAAGDAPFVRLASVTAPARERGARLQGWVRADGDAEWWGADAPDVPSRPGLVPMLLARRTARQGAFLSVWSWRDVVADVVTEGDDLLVLHRDGRRDRHVMVGGGWRIDVDGTGARDHVVLGGFPSPPPATPVDAAERPAGRAPVTLPARFALGEPHYRRSELSWREAGEPRADVTIAMEGAQTLVVAVVVEPSHRLFVAPDAVNTLDNEPAAINGDGVQLYLACGAAPAGWLLVPRAPGADVTVHAVPDRSTGIAAAPPRARWRPTPRGYAMEIRVAIPRGCSPLRLDLVVNETAPGRARRRGQLVLSGATGEFVYLRGDRHDPSRLLRFSLPDA